MQQVADPHLLRMTAYPPGPGPYERWELTVEATGEVLMAGSMPLDHDAIREFCRDYHRRIDAESASG